MVRTAPGGLTARAKLAMAGVGIAAAATWYLAPVFSGDHGDVAVYGGDSIEASLGILAFQLHDRGRDIEWMDAGPTWCDLSLLDLSPPSVDVVVLAPESTGTCDGDPRAVTLDRLRGHGDIVIVPLGATDARNVADVATETATVVDTASLLGVEGTISMPCQWWDDCEGFVAVRGDSGGLTAAGYERLARSVSAAIG